MVAQDVTSSNHQQRGLGFVEGIIIRAKDAGYSVAVIGNDYFTGAVSDKGDESTADVIIECAVPSQSTLDYCATEAWDNSSAVSNSLVHEIDVIRWLLGEDYATAELRFTKNSRRSKEGLHDPQCLILTTKSGVRIDVEHSAFNGHCYDIKCEVVCEDGILNLPHPANIEILANAFRGSAVDKEWATRFETAYDIELQAWINGCLGGYVDGPTAWDGYACQVAAAAAGKARETQTIVPIVYDEKPDFYKK